jgi:hypothetical protein
VVASKEFSLVTNKEVRARKFLSTKVGKRVFGITKVWERP